MPLLICTGQVVAQRIYIIILCVIVDKKGFKVSGMSEDCEFSVVILAPWWEFL